jgi:hypothetical protein
VNVFSFTGKGNKNTSIFWVKFNLCLLVPNLNEENRFYHNRKFNTQAHKKILHHNPGSYELPNTNLITTTNIASLIK